MGVDAKIIERVRALLAKAESTDFPEEAEAFTAKAQELIARHAIDLAMLESELRSGHGVHGVERRRVIVDNPYARAKSRLLAIIADANRCSSVWCPEPSWSSEPNHSEIFGAAHDLDAVELLYTSLLTQATAAMVTAGRAGARSRSRSFRQTFLVAYASRIGERLRQATDDAVDEARQRHGDEVLPVLASQQAAADAARDEAFPQLRRQTITVNDYGGWVAGRAAADMARIGPDAQIDRVAG